MSKFFITAKAKDKAPEILVYGLIGEEANASDFVRELKSLEKDHSLIHVRINSSGGSILEGLSMYNAMMNSSAEIHTFIDGVAASMAAVMAMGGRKVYMSKYSRLMTHSGKGALNGNADQLRQTADLLDGLDNTMCSIYARKTGKTVEQCKIDYVSPEDKWFTPEAAMAEKLVDEIFDADPISLPGNLKASAEVWEYYNDVRFAAVFNNAKTQTETMELKLSAASKTALGIPDNADFAAIDQAIGDLKAKADKVDTLQATLTQTEAELKAVKSAQVSAKIDTLLAEAKTAKKINDAAATKLKADYAENPDGLKAVLDLLPAHTTVTSQLNTVQDETGELAELSKENYTALDKAGKLPRLKALSLDVFKAKFKEHYKIDYAGA